MRDVTERAAKHLVASSRFDASGEQGSEFQELPGPRGCAFAY